MARKKRRTDAEIDADILRQLAENEAAYRRNPLSLEECRKRRDEYIRLHAERVERERFFDDMAAYFKGREHG